MGVLVTDPRELLHLPLLSSMVGLEVLLSTNGVTQDSTCGDRWEIRPMPRFLVLFAQVLSDPLILVCPLWCWEVAR
jgi:hypothetical protein